MKTILITIFTFIALGMNAQDFSTINFIADKGGFQTSNVYLDTLLVGTLKQNENIQFKIYSEGNKVIKVINMTYPNAKHKEERSAKVEIKRGTTYYFRVSFDENDAKLLNPEKGQKLFVSNQKTIHADELSNLIPKAAPEVDLSHATVYFVRTDAWSFASCYISFPNQQEFNLPSGSLVQYKVISEGDISIGVSIHGANGYTKSSYINLEVKRGTDYYILCKKGDIDTVSKDNSDVIDIIDNPRNVAKREENSDFPINKASLKDITRREGKGQGTCFLISTSGYFITNYHCVENAKEIMIKGIDGDFTTKYGATVIASDPSNDLALIKVGNKNLKFNTLPFGVRSSGVEQGEKVYALGFPRAEAMGQEIKLTEGIISSKSGVQGDISKFQISASVNPGNSGGPLIDEQGNIIGVIYAKSTIADAAGYAIKAGYLETFLKNVDGFEYPIFTNSVKEKILTDKIKDLKNFIYIIEVN